MLCCALATQTTAAATDRTFIFNLRGVRVGYVYAQDSNSWIHGNSAGECWVATDQRHRQYNAEFTHSSVGSLVRFRNTRTWRAWYGRQRMGTAILRTPTHADLFASSGRRIGYTDGPAPLAAASARLLLDPSGCTG